MFFNFEKVFQRIISGAIAIYNNIKNIDTYSECSTFIRWRKRETV